MVNRQQIEWRRCVEQDLPAVRDLLKKSDLPYQDVSLEKISFIVAVADKKIIGCIGVEHYGKHGLLRSMAVRNSWKNKGVGSSLLNHFLRHCHQIGIEQVHLLTVTADAYFESKEFQRMDRSQAPPPIQNTAEFTHLCPDSSVYMVKMVS